MPGTVKKPTPLSVRLTHEERESLLARAGARNLSEYVKQVLFDGAPVTTRSSGVSLANRTLLAHLLATLGASELAPNLDRLAHEAEMGMLSVDEEVVTRLLGACDDVRLMHNALMRGLGMREKQPSDRELRASSAFRKASGSEDSN